MDAIVAIDRHEIEISHRGKKVQISIAAVATTGVVKGVERTVAKKVLLVFLHHCVAHLLVQLGGLLAEELLEHGGGE